MQYINVHMLYIAFRFLKVWSSFGKLGYLRLRDHLRELLVVEWQGQVPALAHAAQGGPALARPSPGLAA